MQKKTPKHKVVWPVVLILAIIFTALGFYLSSLLFFMISGILTGLFYGWNNYRIFHYPHTDEFYKDYLTKERHGFTKIPPENIVAKLNTVWVHLACGVTGSITLYLLSTRISFVCPTKSIEQLNWVDGVLFVIAILGYIGLLPRTLWFGNLLGVITPKNKPGN